MDIDYLRTFISLANTKSYEKTAEELFISKATISHRISRMIGLLGFDPFISRRHDITLNAKGVELLRIAEEIVLLEDKALRLGGAQELKTQIRIGAGEMVAITYIMPLVRRLQKKFPNTIYSVDINNYVGTKEKLLRGSLDVAVIYEDQDLLSFRKEKLCKCYPGVLMPKGHPLEKSINVTMDDVLQYPLVLRQSNSMPRRLFSSYISKYNKNNRNDKKYNLVAEVSNSSALESMLIYAFKGENAVSICTTMYSLETTKLTWRRITDLPETDIYIYTSNNLAEDDAVSALSKGLASMLSGRIKHFFMPDI